MLRDQREAAGSLAIWVRLGKALVILRVGIPPGWVVLAG